MDYRLIVLGETALAFGALSAEKDALCIGSGIIAASEFCQAFLSPKQSMPQTEQGRALHAEMEKRGILINGSVHLPAVSDVLAAMAYEKKQNVWLGADILGVRAIEGGFAVDVFCVDGLRTVTAERLIDSTSEGFDGGARRLARYKKEIRVPLLFDGGFFPEMPEGVHVEFGPLEHEAVLCLSVPIESDWQACRAMLRTTWLKLYDGKTGWKLAGEALKMTFVYDAPLRHVTEDGRLLMPSASFGDLTAAYEEGVRCI